MTDSIVTSNTDSSRKKEYLVKHPEFKVEGVSKKYRWYVFTILCLLYLFDYADRLILSSVQELIKAEWELSDTELGSLSTVVWVTVGFLALPASFCIDRWSRRKSISIMALVWSLACMGCRFVTGFGQLFVLRGILGAGEAGYSAGGLPLFSAYFSREQRSKIIGYFGAFAAIGAATGVFVGGFVAAKWGWRAAFGVISIPGIVLAVLAWFIKDYETVPLDTNASNPVTIVLDTISRIIRIPSFIFATLGAMFHDIAYAGLMIWMVSFISRSRVDLTNEAASTLAGAIMLMALIGAPLGGLIADKWYQITPRGRNYTAALSNLLMSVMIIVFCQSSHLDSLVAFIAIGMVMGISVTLYIAADGSINQDIVHQGYRSVVWGMRMFFCMALGGAVGIFMTGLLSDLLESLQTSMMIMSIFGFLGAASYLIGARFYEQDLAKVKIIDLTEEIP